MDLHELHEHIAAVREALEIKKSDLDRLFFTDPSTGMAVRFQIECLEPRLRELERTALRLAKEREAHSVSV